MKYALLYYALLILLFFSFTYAVDTSFYPDIDDGLQNDNVYYVSNNDMNDDNVRQDNVYVNTDSNLQTKEISFIWDERINNLVQYAYNKCLEVIGDTNWYYSCVNMVLTFDSENGAWGWRVVSPTSDYGICALHYKWHKDFIDDKERFENPHNQIDYCIGVRQNAMERNKMPRVAYAGRNKNKYRFIISQ